MEGPTLEQSIKAITDSRPPATDSTTYLTIVEAHLTPELLSTLNDILQDVELCQSIGWDLIQLLIPMKGAEQCLKTVARLGNPREVVLMVTEALRKLRVGEEGDDIIGSDDGDDDDDRDSKTKTTKESKVQDEDKFATLVAMLATLHPRIKTKYPSRFLSTSMMAILASYTPSPQATYAVISFIQALSGTKRPPLPARKSSMGMDQLTIAEPAQGESAADPEASEEDAGEAAIQKKLVQSFLTHVLELYVAENKMEWAPRLLEHYQPKNVVQHGSRTSRCEAFRTEAALQEREVVVGQIVALAKDLSLSDTSSLLSLLTKTPSSSTPPASDAEDEFASSPDDIPLSRPGTLFLLTSTIFSSTLFSSTTITLPSFTLFPTFSTLLHSFIGTDGSGPESIGSEPPSHIDALLTLGLYLEQNDKFVNGPLEDEEYLQLLQTLSLLSAHTPDGGLRYAAHILTGKILHAHPSDRVRLGFLSDTLEDCPFEGLRASAVGWLREELVTAHQRASSSRGSPSHSHSHSPDSHSPAGRNAFATPAALTALQPYLFPFESFLEVEDGVELAEEFQRTYPFHMAAVGFLVFLRSWEGAGDVLPGDAGEEWWGLVEGRYLVPLEGACGRLVGEGEGGEGMGEVGFLGHLIERYREVAGGKSEVEK